MRKACKIILPIALIVLVASVVLYVLGLKSLPEATKAISNNIWNYYVVGNDKVAKYIKIGVISGTAVLAFIRAIAIRKKKSVCFVDFLLILMFNGAAAYAMKDVIKNNIDGDIMLLCSVVAYAVHLVLILVCMLVSIAGKKHEKSKMRAVIVGPATYLLTFVIVAGVFGVLFVTYKTDMFAHIGVQIKQFVNYFIKFKGGWDEDHVKNALILVIALSFVTFAALATIVRKRNLMPVLYAYVAVVLFYAFKLDKAHLNTTLETLNNSTNKVQEVCAPVFVIGFGLILLVCSVQVFNMLAGLVDLQRKPEAKAQPQQAAAIISDEEKAEAQAIMQEIEEDEAPVEEETEEPTEEAEEVEEVQEEEEQEIVEDEPTLEEEAPVEDEESVEQEPAEEEVPVEDEEPVQEEEAVEEEEAKEETPAPAPQPAPVVQAAAEEEDEEEFEDEEFDGEEDEEEEDYDDWEEEDEEVKPQQVKAEDDELLLDDLEEEDNRDALRRRRESIRERIMAARNNENEIVEYAIEDAIVEEDILNEEEDSLESTPALAPQPAPAPVKKAAPAPVDEDEDEDDEDDEIDEEAYNESVAYDDEEDEEEDDEDDEEEEEDEDDEVERNRAALREKLAQQRAQAAAQQANDTAAQESQPTPIVMPIIEEEFKGFKKIKAKPMKDKMATALDDDKRYRYNVVRNELESYKKVHERMSSKGESFRYHKELIAKISVAGKSVRLHLALNPDDYQNTKYHFKDLSGKNRYALVPFTIKLSSNRSVKYSLELIQQLAAQFGLKKNPKYSNKDYAKDIVNAYNDEHPQELEAQPVEDAVVETPVEETAQVEATPVETPVAEETLDTPVAEETVEAPVQEEAVTEEPVEEEVVEEETVQEESTDNEDDNKSDEE